MEGWVVKQPVSLSWYGGLPRRRYLKLVGHRLQWSHSPESPPRGELVLSSLSTLTSTDLSLTVIDPVAGGDARVLTVAPEERATHRWKGAIDQAIRTLHAAFDNGRGQGMDTQLPLPMGMPVSDSGSLNIVHVDAAKSSPGEEKAPPELIATAVPAKEHAISRLLGEVNGAPQGHMSIRSGDHTIHMVDGAVIVCNHSKVVGQDNLVLGAHNQIYGHRNVAIGGHNAVHGTGNMVHGKSVKLNGPGGRVLGGPPVQLGNGKVSGPSRGCSSPGILSGHSISHTLSPNRLLRMPPTDAHPLVLRPRTAAHKKPWRCEHLTPIRPSRGE